jgi:hypothetical protein
LTISMMRLLNKDKQTIEPTGWRREHRQSPSLKLTGAGCVSDDATAPADIQSRWSNILTQQCGSNHAERIETA